MKKMNETNHDVLDEQEAQAAPEQQPPQEEPADDAHERPGTDPDLASPSDIAGDDAHESGSVQTTGEGSPEEAQASEVDIVHVKRVLEAALLSSTEPLSVQQLRRLFSGQVSADNLRKTLDELREEWSGRAIELTAVASGWRFRVKPEYQVHLDKITHEKPPRYSRAVLETLAIIAYRQPVTRGDIEEVRGVAVSPATLKALEERGWIEAVGHRETPGRPALFATTRKFLDDLNLRSLEELPALEELQSTLEPQPQLAAIEADSAPQQESLIGDEPLPPEDAPEDDSQEEPESHAG